MDGSATHAAEWWQLLRKAGPEGLAAHERLRATLLAGVRRIFGRRGMSDDLCEDVVQEALVRIQAKIDGFRGDSAFESWALAIATRLGFDELRHRRWKDVSLDALLEAGSAAALPTPPEEPSPDRALVRGRVVAAMGQVIDTQLTDRQRQALLAELEGMPQAEIAERLGTNRNALYKLSHDARRKLKAQLEAMGLVAADVRWAFE